MFLALSYWRDRVARDADESTQFVLPFTSLVKLARAVPHATADLPRLLHPVPLYVRANARQLVDVVHAAAEFEGETDDLPAVVDAVILQKTPATVETPGETTVAETKTTPAVPVTQAAPSALTQLVEEGAAQLRPAFHRRRDGSLSRSGLFCIRCAGGAVAAAVAGDAADRCGDGGSCAGSGGVAGPERNAAGPGDGERTDGGGERGGGGEGGEGGEEPGDAARGVPLAAGGVRAKTDIGVHGGSDDAATTRGDAGGGGDAGRAEDRPEVECGAGEKR